MRIVPITFREACSFIKEHHRHNKPPRGMKFAVGLRDDDGNLVGVATAGRPVARRLCQTPNPADPDGDWLDLPPALEVNRTCTTGCRNANSMLYGAVRRAAVAMGYERIYTYTQEGESGASLRAAGYREDKALRARRNWAESSVKLRAKRDTSEPSGVPRTRWVWP